jgi:outer membrane protein OmpA-like peptidoglycan-associated protein
VKRSSFFSFAVALALVSSAPIANAQAEGFVADPFEPSERGSDWFTTESLDFRGPARPGFGVVGNYARRPLVAFNPDDTVRQTLVASSFALNAGAVLNLVDRFRLVMNLPIYAGMDGEAQTIGSAAFPAPSGGGLGDLRFGGDLRVMGTYGDPFTIALGIRAWAPTGDTNGYTGDGKWRGEQHVLFAGEGGIFAYAARLAYVYRWRDVTFDGDALGGSGIDFSGSMGLRVLQKRLTVGPEIYGRTRIDSPFSKRQTPVEALFGAHFAIVPSLRVGAGIGGGLTNAYGSPDLRMLFSLEWFMDAPPSDRDEDGIPDSSDACPDEKGVKSDDAAKNGCPLEPAPEPEKEVVPPKTDKDGDGVFDNEDACVDVPGVRTDDPSTNGCPDDTDKDGILNKEDACPNEAGIKTDNPKTNGCPDDDKDGIVNAEDACPDQPGAPDPDPKKNGCPKAYIKGNEIKITDQVKFKTNSSEILPGKDSEEILRAVYKILSDHPEVKRVRIEGYTDSKGTAALNKKLSAARAASVVKWLVQYGIDKQRLSSAGFGPEHPIGDNKTEEGRKQNRRVEFHIDEQKTPKE